MNLKDPKRPVSMFPSKNGGIWGRAGVAIGANGNIFAETGDGGYDPAKGEYSDTVLEVDARCEAGGSLRAGELGMDL